MEDKRFVPRPDWARRLTDAEGFTIFGSFDTVFIDPARPPDSIAGTIRHETLHLEQPFGEKLEMIQQDRAARALSRKEPIDSKTGVARLPFGEIQGGSTERATASDASTENRLGYPQDPGRKMKALLRKIPCVPTALGPRWL
jgi:hypothetical protein